MIDCMLKLKTLALLRLGMNQRLGSRLTGRSGVLLAMLLGPAAAVNAETYHWVIAGHEDIGEFPSAYTACEAWVNYNRVNEPDKVFELDWFFPWTTTSFRCAYRWHYADRDDSWWGHPGGPLVVREGDECPTPGGDYAAEFGECVDRDDECTVGNPISVALGYKLEEAEDIPRLGHSLGPVQRRYRHDTVTGSWTFSFQKRIEYRDRGTKNGGFHQARLHRPDGRELIFTGTKSSGWEGPLDERLVLENRIGSPDEFTGWTLLTHHGVTEQYNAEGQLTAERTRAGNVTVYHYEAGRLRTIEDEAGNAIAVEYDAQGRVEALVANSVHHVEYEYDTKGRLSRVAYPDESAVEYRYEDPRFPGALTGIIDGNGQRYASWTYDDQGRAVRSEHAGGEERYDLSYHTDGSTTVTNPLGKKTTYHFETLHGVRRIVQVEGHPTAHCAAANKAYTYTPEGWLASKTDWNGNTTTYQYNARGLESRRVEAVDTPEQRTITTEWHLEFNAPVKIITPESVTVYSYNDSGDLIGKQVTPVSTP